VYSLRVTSLEWWPLLTPIGLALIGRFFLPPVVLALALHNTDPQERADIIRELNVFFRRRRFRRDDEPPSGLTKQLPPSA
jgi:hypothetical protein